MSLSVKLSKLDTFTQSMKDATFLNILIYSSNVSLLLTIINTLFVGLDIKGCITEVNKVFSLILKS